jgi:uracil-DNA glycosylase family 4
LRDHYPAPAGIRESWVIAQRQLVSFRTDRKLVGKQRQQFFTYRGSRVIVTYHPSYLLRNPPAKRHVWDDLQMLLKEMGIELPAKPAG